MLIKGEASSAANASQKATKSVSESSTGGGCNGPSGKESSGIASAGIMGAFDVAGGATLVNHTRDSNTF